MHGSNAAAGAWLLALILIAPGARAADEAPDLARGAKLYTDNCGRCHNFRAPTEHSDRNWGIAITHMRVTAGIPGDQARAIEAYLRASNNPPRPAMLAEPAAPAVLSGAELIERYGCLACHVIEGQGGVVAPELDTLFERRDVDWIRVQLQDPRAHNPTTVMPNFGLTNAQVDAIIETLRH